MWSLKGFTDPMSRILGTTPAALYERQRALVRANLLESEGGKGPGSGVRATPQTVAMLLISAIAATSLSEVEARTQALAEIRVVKKGKRPPVEVKTFAELMTWALASSDNAKMISHVKVSHTEPEAIAFFHRYRTGPAVGWLIFGHKNLPPPGTGPRRLIRIEAYLDGDALKQIADDLHATSGEADAG